MGGEKTPHESSADASSSGADARAVPLDGDEFVVVEQENLRQQADLPGKGPSPVSPADSAALGYVLNAAQSCLFLGGRASWWRRWAWCFFTYHRTNTFCYSSALSRQQVLQLFKLNLQH